MKNSTAEAQRTLRPQRGLPPLLQAYVDFIAAAGRPVEFREVMEGVKMGKNGFRHLLRRGLVRDIVPNYQKGEPYTGPRIPNYVLTELGQSHVSSASPRLCVKNKEAVCR